MMKGIDPPEGAMFGQNRKARSFGPPGGGRQHQGPVGEGFDPIGMGGGPNLDQAGLPRPAWGNSFDANRAMKLPPLEVGMRCMEALGIRVQLGVQ